jgi:hypothetical protein
LKLRALNMRNMYSPTELHRQLQHRIFLLGARVVTSVILATQEAVIRAMEVRGQPGQIVGETLSQKYPTQKRAGRVAQIIDCPSIYPEALNSNPSTTNTRPPPNTHTHTFLQGDVGSCCNPSNLGG